MTTPQTRTSTRRPRRAGGLWIAALAMTGVALLIWSKLRLVTGLPRTAYADPRVVQPRPAEPDAERHDHRRTASADEPLIAEELSDAGDH